MAARPCIICLIWYGNGPCVNGDWRDYLKWKHHSPMWWNETSEGNCHWYEILLRYENYFYYIFEREGKFKLVWLPFNAMPVFCSVLLCSAVANLRLFTMKSYFIWEEVNFNGWCCVTTKRNFMGSEMEVGHFSFLFFLFIYYLIFVNDRTKKRETDLVEENVCILPFIFLVQRKW